MRVGGRRYGADVTDIPTGGASFKDDDGYYITASGSVAFETNRKWAVDDEDDEDDE
jgi:hypothetical protein